MITPKISYDVAGRHTVKGFGGGGSLSVNSAMSFGVEFLQPISEDGFAGLGLMYLLPREQEISGSGKFNFVPIYCSVMVPISNDSESVIPNIIANIGYNLIFTGEAKYSGGTILRGGVYVGGGLRFSYKKIFLEGLYKLFSGTADLGENVNSSYRYIDISYTTFSIGIGFRI